MARYVSYDRVGVETDDSPALLRVELARYWPTTLAYVKWRTGIDLSSRIVQAKGGAQLSAGTHWDGAAVDLRTRDLTRAQILAVVAALRELGWAAWYRDWSGNQHIHAAAHLGWSLMTGCLYQVRAWKDGFNGLDSGGRGGPDPHPRPTEIRTIAQGAIWALNQIATDPTTPTPQEDDMTPEQDTLLRQINLAVRDRKTMDGLLGEVAARNTVTALHKKMGTGVTRGGKWLPLAQEVADAKSSALRIEGQLAGLTAALKSMAAGQGVDLAAVEAAARRGVEQGLAGATVTVELGPA